MSINPSTKAIHHIGLRSTNLQRSKQFYVDTMGFKLLMDSPALFVFQAAQVMFACIAPKGESAQGDQFNPFRAGLDHIALACEDEAELQRVAAALTTAGVETVGVETDPTLGKRYVAFKDPDKIAWEFYMM